jgi:ceramide glucosyltransferase
MLTAISALFLAFAGIGIVYALIAGALVRQFTLRPMSRALSFPAITILKPLHGIEPNLFDNLASFCHQNYRGQVQIIFGVQQPNDPAVAVVRDLMAAFPAADIHLVIDPSSHGANRKIANLINMERVIRHDVVVLADSDTVAESDYLSRIIGALEQPGVGLVTCVYRGTMATGVYGKLASMAIDYHFLPSVVAGLCLGRARPCFGATIALRRGMLATIGGFEAFADYLADDYAIGAAVRRAGQTVAIPTLVIPHSCSMRSWRELMRQELRWARTVRSIDPRGFLGSLVTHPLPFVLLAVAIGDFDMLGLLLIVAVLACRLWLQIQVDLAIGSRVARWPFGPLRDLLSFLVFVASFFVASVNWRGHRYLVRADGTLVANGDSKP